VVHPSNLIVSRWLPHRNISGGEHARGKQPTLCELC
jgi:hypothetical protein